MKIPNIAVALNGIDEDLLAEAFVYQPQIKRIPWKKWSLLAACFACLLLLIPISDLFSVPVNARIDETEQTVIVYVGDMREATGDYAAERRQYIQTLAETEPEKTVDAVLGLDRYYTAAEAAVMTAPFRQAILRLYVCTPGDAAWVIVPDAENNHAFADRLADTHRIYAVSVRMTAAALDRVITETDGIAYADVAEHVQAQAYAAEKGKTVVYEEAPVLPDVSETPGFE